MSDRDDRPTPQARAATQLLAAAHHHSQAGAHATPTDLHVRIPGATDGAAPSLVHADGVVHAKTPDFGANSPEVGASGIEHAHAASLQREILVILRQAGPSSPDQIAQHLGASRTGVLQQLRALEEAELVSRRTVRHGVGRPRHLYDVTPPAQRLFPSNYDGLAASLVSAIQSVGGDELIRSVFDARRRLIAERVRKRLDERLAPDASMADRVREFASIQDELGYLCTAELGPDGTIRLREHNCAVLQVAHVTGTICSAEIELLREVFGREIVRESHIAAGDRCCQYRILERVLEPARA